MADKMSREQREQRFRQIVDGLFEIAESGPVKNSLWQAYQSLLLDPTLQQEAEAVQREVNVCADGSRIGCRLLLIGRRNTNGH